MKKNFNLYLIIWTVSIVAFSIITFVSPSEKIGSFWVGYIFVVAMFIVQLVCSYIFFKQEIKDKVFLNIPLLTISYIALFVSLIFSTVFIAVPNLPVWIAVTISVIVTAFDIIAIVSTNMAIGTIEKTETKLKAQTFFIKSLTVDAQTLMMKAKSEEIKEIAYSVYEAVRYSDPMSNDALAAAESSITIKFKELEKAVIDDNINLATDISNDLLILINDRNQKCKLLK
ncbi:MAG: hypothetical protein ACI4IL_09745 [Eubacterium sp.]